MHFNKQNARNYAELSHISRRNNEASRTAKLALAEQRYLKSLHQTTYVEDRLVNLRSQLLRTDKLIAKCRDSKRMKDLAIAAKFLNDQERALVRPMSAAAEKASKVKPPSTDII